MHSCNLKLGGVFRPSEKKSVISGDLERSHRCHVYRLSGADPCSTLGGIIPHFYRFFGILKFWGGYSGFADFSSFNDFENLGVYSGFNENVLKQLKTRIRMHKINK